MKRIICVLIITLLLAGCSGKDECVDRAMALRSKMLAQGVSFDAQITADYGDKTYTFAMNCVSDVQGNLTFTVTQPESLAGITGSINGDGGKLTFDTTALAFGLMADNQLSPVSGPWIFLHTLRSGYLTSCGPEGNTLRLAIDDSYEEDALHLDIWLGDEDKPVRGEILWKGRRLLTIHVENFQFV